jgi:threonine dehydratase
VHLLPLHQPPVRDPLKVRGVSLGDVRSARAALAGYVRRTPLVADDRLSEALGADVRVKVEHLQRGGSFKIRGILNRVLSLTEAERAAGIVTVSSGNAAIASAMSARLMGIGCTVVMQEHAVEAKLRAVRELGATVLQHGRTDAEMSAKAAELVAEQGYAVVHPYDQAEVVAGHGTLGMELAEEAAAADDVVVPASGGGLVAGICVGLGIRGPRPRVVAVQPEGADGIRRSLDAGRVEPSPAVDTIADGLNGEAPGALAFEIIRSEVHDVVLVSDDEILRAMALIWDTLRMAVEPAAAAAMAALLRDGRFRGRRVVVVSTGANVGLDLVRHAVEGGSAADWKRQRAS